MGEARKAIQSIIATRSPLKSWDSFGYPSHYDTSTFSLRTWVIDRWLVGLANLGAVSSGSVGRGLDPSTDSLCPFAW